MKFYKYCPWDISKNEHIRNNLIDSILYFQSPNLLNDPFELFPSMQTGNSQKQIKKHIANFYIKDGWSKSKAQHFALNELKRYPLLRTDSGQRTYAEEFAQGLKKLVGISSFTIHNNNLLMWAHYADFHKGVCLKFDFPEGQSIVYPPPKSSFMVYPTKVTYSNTRPKFPIFDRSLTDINDFFLVKSEDWKYEDEYRAIVPSFGCWEYPVTFLSGIIAGSRMESQDIDELRTIVTKMKWQPQIYKATLHNDIFGLEINKL